MVYQAEKAQTRSRKSWQKVIAKAQVRKTKGKEGRTEANGKESQSRSKEDRNWSSGRPDGSARKLRSRKSEL